MILFRNLIFFVFVFLPLTLAIGLACGFFVGPLEPPRLMYEVQQYYFRVFVVLLPSILAVPVLHFLYRRRARHAEARSVRRLAIALTPLALLVVHLAIFGGEYWSIPLIVLFVLPGGLYGLVFAIARPAE
jgi:hypothetical protein